MTSNFLFFKWKYKYLHFHLRLYKKKNQSYQLVNVLCISCDIGKQRSFKLNTRYFYKKPSCAPSKRLAH